MEKPGASIEGIRSNTPEGTPGKSDVTCSREKLVGDGFGGGSNSPSNKRPGQGDGCFSGGSKGMPLSMTLYNSSNLAKLPHNAKVSMILDASRVCRENGPMVKYGEQKRVDQGVVTHGTAFQSGMGPSTVFRNQMGNGVPTSNTRWEEDNQVLPKSFPPTPGMENKTRPTFKPGGGRTHVESAIGGSVQPSGKVTANPSQYYYHAPTTTSQKQTSAFCSSKRLEDLKLILGDCHIESPEQAEQLDMNRFNQDHQGLLRFDPSKAIQRSEDFEPVQSNFQGARTYPPMDDKYSSQKPYVRQESGYTPGKPSQRSEDFGQGQSNFKGVKTYNSNMDDKYSSQKPYLPQDTGYAPIKPNQRSEDFGPNQSNFQGAKMYSYQMDDKYSAQKPYSYQDSGYTGNYMKPLDANMNPLRDKSYNANIRPNMKQWSNDKNQQVESGHQSERESTQPSMDKFACSNKPTGTPWSESQGSNMYGPIKKHTEAGYIPMLPQMDKTQATSVPCIQKPPSFANKTELPTWKSMPPLQKNQRPYIAEDSENKTSGNDEEEVIGKSQQQQKPPWKISATLPTVHVQNEKVDNVDVHKMKLSLDVSMKPFGKHKGGKKSDGKFTSKSPRTKDHGKKSESPSPESVSVANIILPEDSAKRPIHGGTGSASRQVNKMSNEFRKQGSPPKKGYSKTPRTAGSYEDEYRQGKPWEHQMSNETHGRRDAHLGQNDVNSPGRYDHYQNERTPAKYDQHHGIKSPGRYDQPQNVRVSGRFDQQHDARASGRQEQYHDGRPIGKYEHHNVRSPRSYDHQHDVQSFGRYDQQHDTRAPERYDQYDENLPEKYDEPHEVRTPGSYDHNHHDARSYGRYDHQDSRMVDRFDSYQEERTTAKHDPYQESRLSGKYESSPRSAKFKKPVVVDVPSNTSTLGMENSQDFSEVIETGDKHEDEKSKSRRSSPQKLDSMTKSPKTRTLKHKSDEDRFTQKTFDMSTVNLDSTSLKGVELVASIPDSAQLDAEDSNSNLTTGPEKLFPIILKAKISSKFLAQLLKLKENQKSDGPAHNNKKERVSKHEGEVGSERDSKADRHAHVRATPPTSGKSTHIRSSPKKEVGGQHQKGRIHFGDPSQANVQESPNYHPLHREDENYIDGSSSLDVNQAGRRKTQKPDSSTHDSFRDNASFHGLAGSNRQQETGHDHQKQVNLQKNTPKRNVMAHPPGTSPYHDNNSQKVLKTGKSKSVEKMQDDRQKSQSPHKSNQRKIVSSSIAQREMGDAESIESSDIPIQLRNPIIQEFQTFENLDKRGRGLVGFTAAGLKVNFRSKEKDLKSDDFRDEVLKALREKSASDDSHSKALSIVASIVKSAAKRGSFPEYGVNISSDSGKSEKARYLSGRKKSRNDLKISGSKGDGPHRQMMKTEGDNSDFRQMNLNPKPRTSGGYDGVHQRSMVKSTPRSMINGVPGEISDSVNRKDRLRSNDNSRVGSIDLGDNVDEIDEEVTVFTETMSNLDDIEIEDAHSAAEDKKKPKTVRTFTTVTRVIKKSQPIESRRSGESLIGSTANIAENAGSMEDAGDEVTGANSMVHLTWENPNEEQDIQKEIKSAPNPENR